MMNQTENLYARRDTESLGEFYMRHVQAMTFERLHDKNRIAAELAWRDSEIARLSAGVSHDPQANDPRPAGDPRVGNTDAAAPVVDEQVRREAEKIALKIESEYSGGDESSLVKTVAIEAILDYADSREDRIAKLEAFKAYVHKRLDDAGVPVDPESSHKAEGCRIGGRLDIVLASYQRAASPAAGVAVDEHAAKVIGCREAAFYRWDSMGDQEQAAKVGLKSILDYSASHPFPAQPIASEAETK